MGAFLVLRDGDEAPFRLLAAIADCKRSLGDFVAVFFGEPVQRAFLRHISILKAQGYMDGFAGRQPVFDLVHPHHGNDRKGRYQDGGRVKPHADKDADGRCCPDGGGGGQAADAEPFFHDDARTQESDAGYDPLNDTGRIGSRRPCGVAAEPVGGEAGNDNQCRRCGADQPVGAHTRSAPVIGAFIADDQSQHHCARKVHENDDVGGDLGCAPVRFEEFQRE